MSNEDVAKCLVLVKGSDENVYIMATKDGAIQGFKNIKSAKKYFSDIYDEAHSLSYERSMSACIHYIQFMPRVVEFEDFENVKNCIAAEEPHLFVLHSIAGSMNAINCRPGAKALWDAGHPPELITNDRP
jgi:hypothetical protein